jgi:K+ transporter
MFKGEKTSVFWIGLLILGMASLILFSIIWYVSLAFLSSNSTYFSWGSWVPPIVGALVFVLIGLYMMKSGVRKQTEGPPATKLL